VQYRAHRGDPGGEQYLQRAGLLLAGDGFRAPADPVDEEQDRQQQAVELAVEECTTCTGQPCARASAMAQSSAMWAASEPSIPTTIVCRDTTGRS